MYRYLLVMLLAVTSVFAGLGPEVVSVVFTRSDTNANVNSTTYLSGSTLLLTNSFVLISATETQDLTGVGVVLRAGNSFTNRAFAATTIATNGEFLCAITLPTHAEMEVPSEVLATVRLQCTLTNAAGMSYTYRSDKLFSTRPGLAY